jgi:nickel-dependent lactate racemase
MSRILRYGKQHEITLDLDDQNILADCREIRGIALEDPVAATAAAVSEPLDFPSLADSTIPGDRIAIALDFDVPQADAIVAGIIQVLLEGHAEPEMITVVCAPGYNSSGEADWSPTQLVPEDIREKVLVEHHNPADKANLAFLGPAQDHSPIYFNRRVCEADVILPVSTKKLADTLGYVGVHGGLFPTFSDTETQTRFYSAKSVSDVEQSAQRRKESQQAAFQLGVQFTIQVIPGPGNSVLHIVAGECETVAVEGERLCRAAWLHRVPAEASLVVATIEGGPDQQTWENAARALHAASVMVQQDGAIVLCTELACPPGPALQRLAVGDEDRMYDDIRGLETPDAIAASMLLVAREQARVYLLSKLDSETVEDLGVGFVSDPEDVSRLSERHESCILLGNAHRAFGKIVS